MPFSWRKGKYGPERVFEVEDVREYRERRDARYKAIIANSAAEVQ
ncbi:MAG: hypothetical protein U5Q44_00075 [Dehalococcoidia bacterium]|nr:hypothetical protein [Dehalococcoidia bacterium]